MFPACFIYLRFVFKLPPSGQASPRFLHVSVFLMLVTRVRFQMRPVLRHRSAAAVPDTDHSPYPFSGMFDSSRFQFFLIVRAAMGIIRCCRASSIRMIGPKRSPHRRSTRLFVRSWIGRSQGKRRRRRLCPDFLRIKFFIIIPFL